MVTIKDDSGVPLWQPWTKHEQQRNTPSQLGRCFNGQPRFNLCHRHQVPEVGERKCIDKAVYAVALASIAITIAITIRLVNPIFNHIHSYNHSGHSNHRHTHTHQKSSSGLDHIPAWKGLATGDWQLANAGNSGFGSWQFTAGWLLSVTDHDPLIIIITSWLINGSYQWLASFMYH